MNVHTKKYLIDGPVGKIEVAVDTPDASRETGAAPRGIALVVSLVFVNLLPVNP